MEGNFDEQIKQAEDYKLKGNEHLKKNQLELAVQEYTKAIELNIPDKRKIAIYYANRSHANLKMENYGFAMTDGEEAIKADATYAKGYYRKASALMAVGKHKEAAAFFKKSGDDADCKEKYAICIKMHKEKLFQESISVDEDSGKKMLEIFTEMAVSSSYVGPVFKDDEPITAEWVIGLMEHMKNQKVFHKKYLWSLMFKLKEILKPLPALVDVEIPAGKEITICGDTHGQYYDLLNIFKLNGYPSEENPYLFNGDFVDRGSFSVEVIICLIAWKVFNPKCMHLTRGNHETKSMNKLYGFEGEVKEKYDLNTYDLFADMFCHFPLVFVINSKVMVCHGGLFSKDGVKLADLKKIDHHREPPEEGLMTELLWSDPSPFMGRQPSKRGVGVTFGPDVAHRFLDDNGLDYLIRSHEMKQNGYEEAASNRVITIFSAPNYCDQMGNKGAFIRINGSDNKPKFTMFDHVEHPKIPVMAYANKNMNFM
jgi:serine/threonine-protein phosphatase 5